MLRRWVEHAFALGWTCIRSHADGNGHVAIDEHAKSAYRPTLEECLAHAEVGGNVEVLLHESDLMQVDAEVDAAGPWSTPGEHEGACLSRSASGGLHAVYQSPAEVPQHRWIRAAPSVDILTKGVWPLPGCTRKGTKRKPSGTWVALSEPVAPGPAPAWISEALPQEKSPKQRAPSRRFDPGLAGPWAISALSQELAGVANTRAGGGRAHAQMMSSGARLGQIIGAGLLDRESVIEQLIAAAVSAGWEEREARRCASDAVEFGTKNPRGPAELPDIEIVNGAAAEAQRERAKGTPETSASAAPPEPNQDQLPSDSPPEPEPPEDIATLDDALALLQQATEANDSALLFKHARALASLSVADQAMFLQDAKRAFKEVLAKTELKRAIEDQRRARAKDVEQEKVVAAKLRRAARHAKTEQAIHEAAIKSGRRRINLYDEAGIKREPKAVHDDAVAALVAGNDPVRLFVRGGNPVRVGEDEEGQPGIVQLEEKELQAEMIDRAIFMGRSRSGEAEPVDPPPSIIRTLLGCGNLPFSKIVGFVRSPVFRPDGSVLCAAGYDKATGLFYCADSRLVVPPVSAAPSPDEVRDARGQILEIFSQFPFVGEASRANACGLLLTTFLQPIVDDNRPLGAVTAREAGSGKGLITESCARVATGCVPKITRFTREDEFEKKIAHRLAVGTRFIQIDNAKRRLESETLESALTSRRFSDRTFGHNDSGFDVPQDATWCVTGNNLELGTEIARRSYLIELNAGVPHPEDRAGPQPGQIFKRLPEWVMANRGRLIWAVLTLGRAWWAAGHPLAKLPPFGNFERWQEVVGGVLEVAGIPGFLANRSRLRTEQDEEGRQWAAFIRAIRDAIGREPFTAKALALGLSKHEAIGSALPDELASVLGRDDFVQRLGQCLRKMVGRRFGANGMRIVRLEDDAHEKVAQWRIAVGEEDPDAS